MAREARRRRGAEIPAPEPGAEIRIWADLHFDDERIRRAAERPWPAVDPMNTALRRSWWASKAILTRRARTGDDRASADLRDPVRGRVTNRGPRVSVSVDDQNHSEGRTGAVGRDRWTVKFCAG